MYDTQSLMLYLYSFCFSSGLTIHFYNTNCFSVDKDRKLHRLRPPGERNLHFQVSNPHSDSDNYCSVYTMMVIVQMNMMIVRVMAAPGGR